MKQSDLFSVFDGIWIIICCYGVILDLKGIV